MLIIIAIIVTSLLVSLFSVSVGEVGQELKKISYDAMYEWKPMP